MWALFAVCQAICTITGTAADAMGIPLERISFPHALQAAVGTVAAPPDQLDLALAAFPDREHDSRGPKAPQVRGQHDGSLWRYHGKAGAPPGADASSLAPPERSGSQTIHGQ
jgi:hypothetical protein